MTDLHDRRASDKVAESKLQADLDAQVLAEDDPSKRANLMVLNAIYRALVANTATTYEVKTDLSDLTTKFSSHSKNEEAIMNRGKGAWFALAWFLGVVQIVVGYVIVDIRDTGRQYETNMHIAQMERQKLGTRIELLEAQKK